MISAAVDLLCCPACGGSLSATDNCLRCTDGHNYDLARQGYVNLLNGPEPANADTADMLSARARVHAGGVFSAATDLVANSVAGRSPILEAGAGTAHHLVSALGTDPAALGVALDVSKAAARLAARSDPRVAAVVADVWKPLPLRSACFDAVLCVFAPRNLGEFARVLRASGRLVIATPGPGHLAGLRDTHGLLHVPRGKQERVAAAATEFFDLIDTRVVRSRVAADAALARDLIAMGPNAFHRVPENVQADEVTIEVTVQVFRPLGA